MYNAYAQAQARIKFTSPYSRNVIKDNPIVYLRLNESSGTIAYDEMGASNGTYQGTPVLSSTGALSDSDKAVSFDEDTDYVTIAQHASIDALTTNFSFEAWAYFHNAYVYPSLVSKGNSGMWEVYRLASDGKIYFGRTSGNADAVTTGIIPLDKWHHIIATYATTANSGKIYIDGVDVTVTGVGATFITNSLVTTLGAYHGGASYPMGPGSAIDDVAIYGVVLNSTQAWDHYTLGKIGSLIRPAQAQAQVQPSTGSAYKDLILADSPSAYWRFGESSGTNADDEIGTADGTYTGGFTLSQTGAIIKDSNTGVALNGSTGYITVPDNASLKVGDSPWSYEAWVQRNTAGQTNTIFGKMTNSPWVGIVAATNKLSLYKIGGALACEQTGTFPTDSNYHHVVVTFDGTTAKMWIDAVDVSGTTADITFADTTSPQRIGTNSTATAEWWNGKLDELAIYKSVLTSQQVLAHYIAGTWKGIKGYAQAQTQIGSSIVADNEYEAQVLADSPVFLAPLDESSGNITDIVGNKTGVVSGSPTYGAVGPIEGHTAIDISAGTQYFTVADHADLDLEGTDLTIELWYARDTDAGTWQGIISKNLSYGVSVNTVDRITLTKPGTGSYIYPTQTVPTDSSWHHYVFTRLNPPAVDTDLKVYIDGVRITDIAYYLRTHVPTNNANDVIIGQDTSTYPAQGKIAYIAIYKSLLSAERISAHYAASQIRRKYAQARVQIASAATAYRGFAQANVAVYIPVYLYPIADIVNNGWIGVVI